MKKKTNDVKKKPFGKRIAIDALIILVLFGVAALICGGDLLYGGDEIYVDLRDYAKCFPYRTQIARMRGLDDHLTYVTTHPAGKELCLHEDIDVKKPFRWPELVVCEIYDEPEYQDSKIDLQREKVSRRNSWRANTFVRSYFTEMQPDEYGWRGSVKKSYVVHPREFKDYYLDPEKAWYEKPNVHYHYRGFCWENSFMSSHYYSTNTA